MNYNGLRILQLLQKRYEICEKLVESRSFLPDYCTVPIDNKTDGVASKFLKMPGSELTTPNPVLKRY